MTTYSAKYGLRLPTNPLAPDMPKTLADYTEDLERVLERELAKGLRSMGFIPHGADVRTLGYGMWTASGPWAGVGITNLPSDPRANAGGTLEVIPFANRLRMLRWTTAALNSSQKPYTWIVFQGYNSWGSWNEISADESVSSVASLKGAITTQALADALMPAMRPAIVQAVSEAAIEAAGTDIEVLDARYRVEHDGTNNVVFGKEALRLRSFPSVRNNSVFGARALYNMAKGIYNDFFGGEAGFYLDGTGFSESTGKATRNAGFGSNTQRFNKTGMNNVTMGRNAMQCNVGGVNNTYLGAGSAQGVAHMRLSDGVIENQLPLEVWGNVGVGSATHRYGMGNQNVAVGSFALADIKPGDGNVAVGAAALSVLGKPTGMNGKTRVDTSTLAEWKSLSFRIADEILTFTAPTGHALAEGFMLQCKIENFETQFWYVQSVAGREVKLTVGMPGYTKTGVMDVLDYYTLIPGPSPSGNIGIGRRAGTKMADGSEAVAVQNAAAIGQDSAFVGDNIISLGNTAQTTHVPTPAHVLADSRDQKEVVNLTAGLSFLKSLRPVSYKHSPRGKSAAADTRRHAGFVGQEVKTASQGTSFEGVAEIGGAFSIAYDELVPVLVKAVQELSNEVDALKGGA